MSDSTRKLATIVALDVAGYSARTEADEARTIAQIENLRPVIEGIAKAHGGRVFNTAGDGFMLEFASALSGVNAALELADECRPRVRVGVHLGEVAVEPNGDLLGHGVNVAARLMAKAEPGSALISGDVRRVIRGPLADRFVSRGPVQLDKMHETIEIFAPAGPAQPATPRKAAQPNSFQWRQWLTPRAAAMAGAPVLLVALALLLWSRPASAPSPSEAAAPEASIAVLPFENLSADSNNAFFATGIQDEILTRLTKIGSLKVISRTSTAHLSSRPENLPEIAKQLGVAHILEGSVQRQGDAVRVNVQLIKAASDSHLWAEVYDRKLENIFSVQSEIAIAVAEALSAKVTGKEKQDLAAIATKNTAAYDAYLRGQAFMEKSEFLNAERLLRQAVELDPLFAVAWANLARTHAHLYFNNDATPARREAARKALDEAVRLQPEAVETALAQAMFQYRIERDYEGAHRSLKRLHMQWPGNVEVLTTLAHIARRQGQWNEAIDYLKQLVKLDPRSTTVWRSLAEIQFSKRDFAEALRGIDAALNIAPDASNLIGSKARMLQALGKLDEAGDLLKGFQAKLGDPDSFDAIFYQARYTRRAADAISTLEATLEADKAAGSPGADSGLLNVYVGILKAASGDASGAAAHFDLVRDEYAPKLKRPPVDWFVLSDLALMHANRGEHEKAVRLADQMVAIMPVTRDAQDGAFAETTRARVLARAGDRERAIPAISRLLNLPGFPPLTSAVLRLDPDFDKLRGDPRFDALTKGEPVPLK